MGTIKSGIDAESNLLNLKATDISNARKEVFELLVRGEDIIAVFQTIRDQVIFTSKRVFVINVQGITGKKTSYISYPYSKIQYYGIETAGVFDIDSELIIVFSDGNQLTFDFRSSVDIRAISAAISEYIL